MQATEVWLVLLRFVHHVTVDDHEGQGEYACGVYFYFSLVPPSVCMDCSCADVVVWCAGIVKRTLRTKGWTGVRPRARSLALDA
jgi:hypothetical protein